MSIECDLNDICPTKTREYPKGLCVKSVYLAANRSSKSVHPFSLEKAQNGLPLQRPLEANS